MGARIEGTNDTSLSGNKFSVDYSKRGTAKYKICTKVIDLNELGLGKLVPFKLCHIKQYSRVVCAFESFQKARVATNMINGVGELDGFDFINTNDKSRKINLLKIIYNARKLPLSKVFPAKERVSPAPTPAKSRMYGLKSSTVSAINIMFV